MKRMIVTLMRKKYENFIKIENLGISIVQTDSV